MSKERKQRSDKKIRVNPSFDSDAHEKLVMLARACDITKTKMAEMIVEMVLNDEKSVQNLQDRLDVGDSPFRITTTSVNERLFFRHKNFIP